MARLPPQMDGQAEERARKHARDRRRIQELRPSHLASQTLRVLHRPHRHHTGQYPPSPPLTRPHTLPLRSRPSSHRPPRVPHAQEQVDNAPQFPQVAENFSHFLAKNGLIHPDTGERLVRFCWCTDGPFDVRDFVVKQCFISKVRFPPPLPTNAPAPTSAETLGANSGSVRARARVLTITRSSHTDADAALDQRRRHGRPQGGEPLAGVQDGANEEGRSRLPFSRARPLSQYSENKNKNKNNTRPAFTFAFPHARLSSLNNGRVWMGAFRSRCSRGGYR